MSTTRQLRIRKPRYADGWILLPLNPDRTVVSDSIDVLVTRAKDWWPNQALVIEVVV